MQDSTRRKRDVETIAPLSPMQKGMLSYSLQVGAQDPYYTQKVFLIEGELDVDALERSWQLVVNRHQVLRADYRWEEVPEPIQIVFRHRPVRLEQEDWSNRTDREPQLVSLLARERRSGFDFRVAADIKLRLIRLG